MILPELSDEDVRTEFKARLCRLTIHRAANWYRGLFYAGDIKIEWHTGKFIRAAHKKDDTAFYKVHYSGDPDLCYTDEVREHGLPALRRYMILDDLANA